MRIGLIESENIFIKHACIRSNIKNKLLNNKIIIRLNARFINIEYFNNSYIFNIPNFIILTVNLLSLILVL